MNKTERKQIPFLIKFLGTAGARMVMVKQLRSSAGTWISCGEENLLLDPGPGTLVRCAKSKPKLEPEKLSAIVLTHAHLDHSSDVNVMIEAMTQGGFKKKGILFAPRDCLQGENSVVLRYLRDYLNEIEILSPQKEYKIGKLRFKTSVKHRHPLETYGITFLIDSKRVSFVADSEYFQELEDSYRGSDLLVLNVVRLKPHESGQVQHLCLEEAERLISALNPKLAVLTHFGMTMLKAKPWVVAEQVSEVTGIRTIAASDGLSLNLDDIIKE